MAERGCKMSWIIICTFHQHHNIISKLRKMRLAGHVAYKQAMILAKFLSEKPKESDRHTMKNLSATGRILFKRILVK